MYMDITQQAGLRTGHQVALDNRLGRVLPDLDLLGSVRLLRRAPRS